MADELDGLVKRLEQEKKLKSLLENDLSPGRTMTKKLLSNAGTKVAGTILAGAGVWAVKTALEGGCLIQKELRVKYILDT